MTEGLLAFDLDFQPRPQLATAREVSGDGLRYRFSLRHRERLQALHLGLAVADALMIAWLDEASHEWTFAAVPADRPGIIVENDWDAIGQRQTGSGRVTFADLKIHADEVLDHGFDRSRPYRTLGVQQQQSVPLNVFIGSAQGALLAARDYTVTTSRPWLHSGVEKHTDDPWVQRDAKILLTSLCRGADSPPPSRSLKRTILLT